MKINKQLTEIHASVKGIKSASLWNNAIHLLVLFIALCIAPISVPLKIIIYCSVTAIVGAIDSAHTKQAISDVTTQTYLRALYYMYREKDFEKSDEKEMEDTQELNELISRDLPSLYPQHDFNGAAKGFLIFSWAVSLIILGLSGYIPSFL